MTHLDASKTGLVLGALAGGWHIIWSLLIWLGWAQPLMDFSFWAHMVAPPFIVGPFDITASVTVIVVAAVIGYVVGVIFAKLWNHFHRA